MGELVSIIIPFYNVETYLCQCLESVKKQTYMNWECLLIDDGSTDHSREICDRYADEDKRFKAFHTEKNIGAAEARNIGIKNATGEYITFIDGDDWVEENYLEFLLDNISDNDWIMCHAMFEYPQHSVDILPIFPDRIVCDGSNKKEFIMSSIMGFAVKKLKQKHGSLNTVWGKLYKMDLIKQNNIVFSATLHEDLLFTLHILRLAGKYEIRNRSLYHYRMRDSSLVHRYNQNFIADWMRLLDSLSRFISLYNNEDEYLKSFQSLVMSSLFQINKNYFYHPDYRGSRRQEQKSLRKKEPFASALNRLNKLQLKNPEVSMCAYVFKNNCLFLLDMYFQFRPMLKKIAIQIMRQ